LNVLQRFQKINHKLATTQTKIDQILINILNEMKECENHNIIRSALYNHRNTTYPYVPGVKCITEYDKTNLIK
jgi:hypothetical protein